MRASAPPPSRAALRCDLFCRVIDNYGDAGVCWRLARQLAEAFGWQVRLLIDVPETLDRLAPLHHRTTAHGSVTVVPWLTHDADADGQAQVIAPPGDVVIEAFACDLPESYLDAMQHCANAPIWINLEYLSAEDWVASCHAGMSRHPQRGLDKTFFFPGFTEGTGGLLREHDLDAQRTAFLASAPEQAAIWRALGIRQPDSMQLIVSLFAYENAGVGRLLDVWAQGGQPVTVLVPEGRISPQIAAFFDTGPGIDDHTALRIEGDDVDAGHFAAGTCRRRGALTVHAVPFLSQPEYDRVLWLADLNFVRGEDSFVRAQWAERPFVWQIYPQDENAHYIKLDAARSRYVGTAPAVLPAAAQQAVRRMWNAWNGIDESDWHALWRDYVDVLPTLREHAAAWAGILRHPGDLATNLETFVTQKIVQRTAK